MKIQLRFLALGFLVLSACSKKDEAPTTTATAAGTPAPASKQAEEDLADVTKYRLTMDKFDKYLAASRNIGMKAKSMTPAQRAAMEQRNEAGDPNASLDQMVANIEKEPMMVEAIREAGLSPREFTMITISFMQTGMAAAVAKMRPNDNQDSLIRSMQANPDNIKFYNENEAEITRKSKALEAEMKQLGITGS
jgi:hypothetical protein